ANRLWRTHWPDRKVPVAIAWPATLMFVTLAWVPFRAGTLTSTLTLLRALFGLGEGRNVWYPSALPWALLAVMAGHVVGVLIERPPSLFRRIDADVMVDAISGRYLVLHVRTFTGAFVVTSAVLAIYFFAAAVTPFIYFQF